MQLPDGQLQEKTKGVMQGGTSSSILSNLFLHYVFDAWMKRNCPEVMWSRYADDGLVHFSSLLKNPPSNRMIRKDLKHLKEQGLIDMKGTARNSVWIPKE